MQIQKVIKINIPADALAGLTDQGVRNLIDLIDRIMKNNARALEIEIGRQLGMSRDFVELNDFWQEVK